MAYHLGNTTLPTPVSFTREFIETSASNNLLDGTTKKDITNRKERFILKFSSLTQAEVSAILAEYELLSTKNFWVDETNLTINSTPVHIDIGGREYLKGSDYRENLEMVLTEVV